MGETGNLNGEDVIDIIVRQPATARFICRHLYNFLVADEVQVPAWTIEPASDEEALDMMITTSQESNYEMKPLLRMILNSEFFKNARFSKIKSPAEMVISTLRLVGGFEFPAPGIGNLSKEPGYMGQELLNPPSVEGWHTGAEWINSGTLMKRVNFAADMLGDLNRPGVQDIVDRIRAQGDLGPEQLVDACLDLMGPMQVAGETRQELVGHSGESGVLSWGTDAKNDLSNQRVTEMLQLIVATREFQYA